MENNHIKTAVEVKAELKRKGISVSAWAKQNGFPREYVHSVLSGKSKGNFGLGHNIAVKLGIKDGEINK